MKTLVAFSASALAAMSCSDGCNGYETVDPLPFPSGGFCGNFSASFKVSARIFSLDAGTPALDDAASDDATISDAQPDAAVADGGERSDGGDGGGAKDGGSLVAKSTRRLLLAIELRPRTTGLSLKRGGAELIDQLRSPTEGPITILEERPSEQLLELEIGLNADPSISFEIHLKDVGDCGGVPANPILTVSIDHDSINVTASLGSEPEQDVSLSE